MDRSTYGRLDNTPFELPALTRTIPVNDQPVTDTFSASRNKAFKTNKPSQLAVNNKQY